VGQAPRTLEPGRSVQHFLGAEVRRLRQERDMSQADLGRALFVHKDLIRKIEAAERTASDDLVERCDVALAAGGALRRLIPMLQRERGLRAGRDTGSRTQGFRSEATDRPVLDWLLASALDVGYSRVSDDESSKAALRLQELRTADHTHGAGRIYSNVTDILGRELDILASQSPLIATGFLELAGYEAVDLGADGTAQQHYQQALAIATRTGNHLYGGYIIAVSLAHLALHCGDPDQAGRLATAALRGTERQTTPGVRAVFRTVLARAQARRGDEAACAATLLQVESDLARSIPSDEPSWIAYFSEADLADEKAHCFYDLGLYELAQREVSRAVAKLEPSRVRRLAIDTALHASSLARSRQIDHACTVARQAIDHAVKLNSFRSSHRIVLMLAELHPYTDLPAVRDLGEYAAAQLPTLIATEGSVRHS